MYLVISSIFRFRRRDRSSVITLEAFSHSLPILEYIKHPRLVLSRSLGHHSSFSCRICIYFEGGRYNHRNITGKWKQKLKSTGPIKFPPREELCSLVCELKMAAIGDQRSNIKDQTGARRRSTSATATGQQLPVRWKREMNAT